VVNFFGKVVDPPRNFVNGLFHTSGDKRHNAQEQQHLANCSSQPTFGHIFSGPAKITPHDQHSTASEQPDSGVCTKLSCRRGPACTARQLLLNGISNDVIVV
jgi:hypothetical protein